VVADEKQDCVILSGIGQQIKIIDGGYGYGMGTFDLLSTRRKVLILPLQRLRGRVPNGWRLM
jgi:hypothetical protein